MTTHATSWKVIVVTENEFKGRVAFITGGGGGCIGGPTALAFAKQGASIAICDMHAGRLEKWAKRIWTEAGVKAATAVLDIADKKAIDTFIKLTRDTIGDVDVLVCNAAENKLGKILEYRQEDWDRTIDVSLNANYYLARQLLPGMVRKKVGTIVNIASIAGWIGDPNPDRGEPAYSVAKAGLLSLTRNIAAELGPHGIRCNAVAPGLIWSRFVEKYEADLSRFKEATPLQRYGTSEDIVEAILFLASDKRAGFITGETLNVSGGYYMRP
jgi:NAD(P)-dependent dehydrogenase (short-subunit alcohol dehydrogenase family)